MGGVVVLHPQDSLKDHSTPIKSHRTINFNHTYTNTPNFMVSDSRKRTPTKGTRKNHHRNTEPVAVVAETPDPMMPSKPMKNSNRTEFFAGSAFVDSPPPSSLPLPGFFTKNFVTAVSVDPTTDLRRILGLSLS